jgi:small subunit ribosomal protein S20
VPNSKSAEKRLRQSEERRLLNSANRSRMKTAVKKASESKGQEASLKQAISAIDRAAAKGVIHKNAAARRKSRLVKKLAKA